MSTTIHLDRALISSDNGPGGAIAVASTNKAQGVSAGDARERDDRRPSDRQKGGSMPRPLWIYFERL